MNQNNDKLYLDFLKYQRQESRRVFIDLFNDGCTYNNEYKNKILETYFMYKDAHEKELIKYHKKYKSNDIDN